MIGILLGAIAGVIDVIPMLAMKLPLAANLSAFSLWVVAGFLVQHTSLKLNSLAKGLVISLLVFLSTAFLIGQNDPADLIPPLVMTVILGSLLGWAVGKTGG